MKKLYSTPELWVIPLLAEDVITTSTPFGPWSGDEDGDGWGDGNYGDSDIFT